MGWVPSRRPPELEAEADEEVATPAGWCWGMAAPDWDWVGKPGRRFGGEEVVTCGLKVTLRGGLGDGREGMEEELEWVGKSGVVSEEDMMAAEVGAGGGRPAEGGDAARWLKMGSSVSPGVSQSMSGLFSWADAVPVPQQFPRDWLHRCGVQGKGPGGGGDTGRW